MSTFREFLKLDESAVVTDFQFAQSCVDFELEDGTEVAGETSANIRRSLTSEQGIKKLPKVGTQLGVFLEENGMKRGKGKRDGRGKSLEIYYFDKKFAKKVIDDFWS